MSLTPSTMLPLGSIAPSFCLDDCFGNSVNLDNLSSDKGLLVAFICNHCPYVIHIAEPLTQLTQQWISQGIDVIAINANDFIAYPDDNREKMQHEVELRGYAFPYLLDTTQQVAKAYQAACTPDFFLFDENKQLVYRGQFDDSRPSSQQAATGYDLSHAVSQLLNNQPISQQQQPSVGCNIKWRGGNEPDYFTPKR